MGKKIDTENIWTLCLNYVKNKGTLPIISCKMQKTDNILYKQACGEISVLIHWRV